MSNPALIHTIDIQDYLSKTAQPCADTEVIAELLTKWPVMQQQTRSLKEKEIKKAQKIIATVPTGKRVHFTRALQSILYYLRYACQWQLPESQDGSELVKSLLTDADHEWFESIANEAGLSHCVFSRYQIDLNTFYEQRKLSTAFMVIMIGFEIAPLSLGDISTILNDSQSITNEYPYPRLRVKHQCKNTDIPHFPTHYSLSLLSQKLLHNYYAQQAKITTTASLVKELKDWLDKNGIQHIAKTQWSRLFQIHWYNQYEINPIFIKDLAQPERHVGLITDDNVCKQKLSDIYKNNQDTTLFTSLSTHGPKNRWQHGKLLRAVDINEVNEIEPPSWDTDNILPRLMFDFTKDWIINGGPKKAALEKGTIRTYTSLTKILTPFPLTLTDALIEESINEWAQVIFVSIKSDAVKKAFYKFLAFLSWQEKTEALDLSNFSTPIIPPSVSAARLCVDECDSLINALIVNGATKPTLHILFCIVAALLGFYAMLRRGEVLRLRIKDIQFKSETGLLTLNITNTREGKTKNGSSRMVYTTIPTRYRYFFNTLLNIKKHSNQDLPLIGHDLETLSSRAISYLVPVSRALRILFGIHFNFHHLRHSGVHIFMLQILHCVSYTPDNLRGQTPLEQEVLSEKSVVVRLDYWFKGREAIEVNSAAFLDNMGKQIGHIFYATTRWSYLHDIDWLLPIISKYHNPHTHKQFSHSALRYLMGLSASSNDLSRLLSHIIPDYDQQTLAEKRRQSITVTEHALRVHGLQIDNLSQAAQNEHMTDTLSNTYLEEKWLGTLEKSQLTLTNFLFGKLINPVPNGEEAIINFESISAIWECGCRHRSQPINNKYLTAYKSFPNITVCKHKHALRLNIACTTKDASAFNAVFRHTEWAWVRCEFELHINRKVDSKRPLEMVKKHYAKKSEYKYINVLRQQEGPSSLTIYLKPKSKISIHTLEYVEQFIKLIKN